jgi:hypothetical protein
MRDSRHHERLEIGENRLERLAVFRSFGRQRPMQFAGLGAGEYRVAARILVVAVDPARGAVEGA